VSVTQLFVFEVRLAVEVDVALDCDGGVDFRHVIIEDGGCEHAFAVDAFDCGGLLVDFFQVHYFLFLTLEESWTVFVGTLDCQILVNQLHVAPLSLVVGQATLILCSFYGHKARLHHLH